MYRCGPSKYVSWCAFEHCMMSFCARAPRGPIGTARRVQLDYLRSVLRSGNVYSMPDVSSAVLQVAFSLGRPAEAAEHLERGAGDGSALPPVTARSPHQAVPHTATDNASTVSTCSSAILGGHGHCNHTHSRTLRWPLRSRRCPARAMSAAASDKCFDSSAAMAKTKAATHSKQCTQQPLCSD